MPSFLRNLLASLRKGSPRFLSVLDPGPTKLPITEARLKMYDYRFVGQDVHKLWRLHVKLGGKMPGAHLLSIEIRRSIPVLETMPPQFIVGDHPGDYWKRTLLQTHSLDEGKADV